MSYQIECSVDTVEFLVTLRLDGSKSCDELSVSIPETLRVVVCSRRPPSSRSMVEEIGNTWDCVRTAANYG